MPASTSAAAAFSAWAKRSSIARSCCTRSPRCRSIPQSVPINQLVQVPGTPLHGVGEAVEPLDFVRVIAVARLLMPRSHVRLSAGRSDMSDETQALCFLAGANSIFYGDKLLTTENPGRASRPAGCSRGSASGARRRQPRDVADCEMPAQRDVAAALRRFIGSSRSPLARCYPAMPVIPPTNSSSTRAPCAARSTLRSRTLRCAPRPCTARFARDCSSDSISCG